MTQKIKIKRGLKVNLPLLDIGELAYCTDTNELFIGTGTSTGNNLVQGVKSLSDLFDIDLTGKTNGYVLTYNSSNNKFEPHPLPIGNGSGATNLDGLTDVDLTILPTNGDVLKYKDGIWKPSELSPVINATYVIDLDAFGITSGLPTKTQVTVGSQTFSSYNSTDYDRAKNNIVGINKALKYAYDQGYRNVVLPNGEYSLCYGKYTDEDGKVYTLSIYPQKNTIIDFSESTLKVIYDSDTLSPYHDRTSVTYSCPNCDNTVVVNQNGTCPTATCGIHIGFWKNSGFAIVLREPNVTIKNLTLIGDRVDRSFYSYFDCLNNYPNRDIRNYSEAGNENTIGINITNRSNGSSVVECDISFFMGDNIATTFQDNTTIAKYQSDVGNFAAPSSWGMQFGNISTSTGANITGSTNDVRTDFISIPINVDSFSLIGLGYQPRTSIPNYTYSVFFYDTNKKFISNFPNARTVDMMYIPFGASYIRISFNGNGTLDDGTGHAPYWMQLVSNGISSNILISRNKIRGGHRGGLFLGGNNVNIEYNEFISNGSTSDLYGLVMFPYMTRYGINSEDNVGQNYKINNNVFLKSRMAIAVRGEYVEISGNEFRQNDIAITLYRLYHATISQNTFIKNMINDYPYNESDFIRNWNIIDNIFTDTSISFTGLSPVSSIESNLFYNSSVSFACPVYTFSENTFVAKTTNPSISILGSGAKNCSFIGNSNYHPIISGSTNLTNCYLEYATVNYTKDNYTSIVRGCKFLNSYVSLSGNDTTLKSIKLYDNRFDFTASMSAIVQGANVGVNTGYSVEFHNCKFKGLTTSAFGMQNVSELYLYDCDFAWNISSSISSPLCSKFFYNVSKLIMNNCNLTSPVNITQTLDMFNNACTLNFVKLSGFSFTTRSNDILQTGSVNDNLLQTLSDNKPLSGTGVPQTVPQKLGQEYYDTTNKKLYKAFGNNATSDWVVMN